MCKPIFSPLLPCVFQFRKIYCGNLTKLWRIKNTSVGEITTAEIIQVRKTVPPALYSTQIPWGMSGNRTFFTVPPNTAETEEPQQSWGYPGVRSQGPCLLPGSSSLLSLWKAQLFHASAPPKWLHLLHRLQSSVSHAPFFRPHSRLLPLSLVPAKSTPAFARLPPSNV